MGGGAVIAGARRPRRPNTDRRQRLHYLAPPSHPFGSPELRLLRAFLDAYSHHLNSPLTPDFDEEGRPLLRNLAAEAEWESALLQERARLTGALSPAERYDRRHGMPSELKALFALPPPRAVMELFGHWEEVESGEEAGLRKPEKQSIWVLGLAQLSDREAEVLGYLIDGLGEGDVQELMDRRRSKRQQALGAPPTLSLRTIENLFYSGRGKLRRLFELP